MVSTEDVARQAAYALANATTKIALIAPQRWNIGKIVPIESMGTVTTKTTTCNGKERSTTERTANVQMWVYNLTPQSAIPRAPRTILKLAGERNSTTVLRMRLPLQHLPENILSLPEGEIAKKELLRLLGDNGHVDSWGARRGEHEDLTVLVRINTAKKEALMKQSGVADYWVDTPRHEMSAHVPLWLGKPKEDQDIETARRMANEVTDHAGMLVKYHAGGRSFAIRVKPERVKEIQAQLKIDQTQQYALTNVPPQLAQGDLQELIDKTGWKAKLTGSREWSRGKALWRLASEDPPPHQCFQVQIGYERGGSKCSRTVSLNPSESPSQPLSQKHRKPGLRSLKEYATALKPVMPKRRIKRQRKVRNLFCERAKAATMWGRRRCQNDKKLNTRWKW